MTVDYSNWPLNKLEKELAKIQKAIDNQKKRNKKETLAKVIAVAKQNGFELNELISGNSRQTSVARSASTPATSKKRGKVKPKYKHPADSSKLWSGRGRQPVWVRDFIASGGSLNDIAI